MPFVFLFLILLTIFLLNISLGFSILGISLFLAFFIYLNFSGDLPENLALAIIFGFLFDLISNIFGLHLLFFIALAVLLNFTATREKKPHLPILLPLVFLINVFYYGSLLMANIFLKKLPFDAGQFLNVFIINSITLMILVVLIHPLGLFFFDWLSRYRSRQKSIL